jgi:PIN domain nuclease of toxin-antitoxin system
VKKILLDTHVFLWWIDNNKYKLIGEKARAHISDPRNDVYVSAVSTWEISIKKNIGALIAPDDIDSIVEDKGFSKLPISLFHGEQAGSLPNAIHPQSGKEHKDPFDRMLIAQAQSEGMYLMTKDGAFSAYAVRLIDAEK